MDDQLASVRLARLRTEWKERRAILEKALSESRAEQEDLKQQIGGLRTQLETLAMQEQRTETELADLRLIQLFEEFELARKALDDSFRSLHRATNFIARRRDLQEQWNAFIDKDPQASHDLKQYRRSAQILKTAPDEVSPTRLSCSLLSVRSCPEGGRT